MSITVYRNRNGVREPMKVSILDAFRGAPPKKVKSELKSSSTSEKPPAFGSSVNNNGISAESKNNRNDNKNQSSKPSETFSANDDAKIVEMKAENKPWKEICAAIGKESQSQVKQHYKDNLEGKPAPAAETGNANNNHSDKAIETFSVIDNTIIIDMKAANKGWKEICTAIGKESQSQVKQHYKDHLEGRAAEVANNDKQEAGNTASKVEDKRSSGASGSPNVKNPKKIPEPAGLKPLTPNRPNALTPNDKLIETIRSYGAQYDERKWLAIASRHYDKTGHRISAKMAQEIYDGKVPK